MAQKHTINDIEKPMTTYGPEQGPNKRYRRLRHPAFPAATWTDNNPLLQKGEIGAETDTHKAKIGDGVTYWNNLPYLSSVGQPLSTADYQMGNALGGWTTMTTAQQDALNSGATSAKISAIDGKVNIDGTSIMTAPLKFMSGSMRGAVGPYLNGVGFWKLDSDANLTLIATLSDSQFIPTTTGAISLGSSAKRFKDLYIGGTGSTIDIDGSTVWFKGYFNLRNQNQTNSLCWHAGSTSNRYAWGLNSDINNVGFQYDSSLRSFMPLIDKAESLGSASFMWKNVYTPKINNGADIAVPTSGGTMALTSDLPSVMTGADGVNAGASGLVPAPTATDNVKFLRGDGTWASQFALVITDYTA